MLTKFEDIIVKVLHHEGGYVNDPKDPGGETNFGIAKRSHPDVDIKNLTEDKAKLIYKEHYWDKNKVEELPYQLRHIYFDMCVNQGKGRAVKILQRAANAKGASLKVDVVVHTVVDGSFKFYFVNKSGGTLANDSTIKFDLI